MLFKFFKYILVCFMLFWLFLFSIDMMFTRKYFLNPRSNFYLIIQHKPQMVTLLIKKKK